jgi:hypothetical protein
MSDLFRETDRRKGDVVSRPTIIFVLGMARSGTSALTRVLSLSGATLPPGMVGAGKANPRGFWEPRKAVFLNEKIQRSHHSSSTDPSPRLYEEQFRANDVSAVHAYLAGLPSAPLIVIKDPAIATLSSVWFDAARQAGYDVAAVISVRHPQEVMASLAAMSTRPGPALSAALWLKYSLLAERCTRQVPRVFVEHANLLDDWRREVKRIATGLSVDLNLDEPAVEDFLVRGQHRQVTTWSACPEPFGTDWMATTYHQLHKAAVDDAWDQYDLSRVFGEYRDAEHGFRTAFDSFERIEKFHHRIPLSIAKLALEGAAIVHRRRGTWA